MKKEAVSQSIQKFLQSRILLYIVICLFLLKLSLFLIAFNFPGDVFFAGITKTNLVNMLNTTRESVGLKTLAESYELDNAARMKAEDMVRQQYFSHVSPQGTTPWFWFLQSGYNYKYAGENLAIGFYDSEEAFYAWLDSPSHRENILNKNYREVGTAVLDGFGSNNAIVVVQLFGAKVEEKTTTQKSDNNTGTILQLESNEDILNPPAGADSLTKDVTLKKVLQGSTTSDLLELSENNGLDDFRSRFLNLIFYNYNIIIQDIVYGVLMIVTGLLLFILLFDFNVYSQKKFIFRSSIIIILILASALLNGDLIILMVPHKILI